MSRLLRPSSVLGALALAIGCSLVVPAELEQIHCSQPGTIGPPACDPGFVCAQGICQRCAATEICGDGIDNDCAGGIDDGCALAGAGGGGTAGSGGSFGGSGGTVPDGGGGLSGSGGVSGQAGAGTGGAQGGESGSSGSGGGGITGIGTPCPAGNECAATDFCTDAGLFGLPAGNVCTRGCCKSEECGAGNVCYPTPGGNALCFPSALAGRPSGPLAVGAGCTTHDECRTGLCLGGACTDACCTNTDCPANIGACQVNDIGGRNAFVCAAAGAGKDYLFTCYSGDLWNPKPVPADCASRVCVGTNAFLQPYVCSKACCREADCSGGLKCRYGALGVQTTKYCRVVSSTGSGALGASCTGPADCQSGLCVQLQTGSRVCTDVCCRDQDCGAPGEFGCRPAVQSGVAHLICVKL
jgi:hypothetical protein